MAVISYWNASLLIPVKIFVELRGIYLLLRFLQIVYGLECGAYIADPIYTSRSSEEYRSNCYLDSVELSALADRWHLPVALLHLLDNNHWNLMLKPPEKMSNGQWRVLVYDPMIGGEIY